MIRSAIGWLVFKLGMDLELVYSDLEVPGESEDTNSHPREN